VFIEIGKHVRLAKLITVIDIDSPHLINFQQYLGKLNASYDQGWQKYLGYFRDGAYYVRESMTAHNAKHVIATAKPSVCLSVCHVLVLYPDE